MQQPQHIDSMKWSEAPEWATHIIGWIGEPQTCYWTQEIDGRYFRADQRIEQRFSFSLTTDDDDGDDYGWEILSERPNTQAKPSGEATSA